MTGIPSRMLTFLSHQYPYSLPHSPCHPTHELFLKRSTKCLSETSLTLSLGTGMD
jgi:hypothetical protein